MSIEPWNDIINLTLPSLVGRIGQSLTDSNKCCPRYYHTARGYCVLARSMSSLDALNEGVHSVIGTYGAFHL